MVATQPSEISLGKDVAVSDDGSIMLRSPAHQALIKKTSSYVYLLVFFQLMGATFSLFGGNLLGFGITMIFIILALQGIKKERRGFLIAHFVYSLLTLFAMIAAFVFLVFYCANCFVLSLFVGIAILVKTVLLRQERILISALSKTDLPICVVKAKSTKEEEKVAAPKEKVSVVPAELEQQVVEEQQQAPVTMPASYYMPMSMPQFGEQGQIQGQPQMFYYPVMDAYGQPQWMPVAQPYFYPGFEVPQQQNSDVKPATE
jgi:hypothetical protein